MGAGGSGLAVVGNRRDRRQRRDEGGAERGDPRERRGGGRGRERRLDRRGELRLRAQRREGAVERGHGGLALGVGQVGARRDPVAQVLQHVDRGIELAARVRRLEIGQHGVDERLHHAVDQAFDRRPH